MIGRGWPRRKRTRSNNHFSWGPQCLRFPTLRPTLGNPSTVIPLSRVSADRGLSAVPGDEGGTGSEVGPAIGGEFGAVFAGGVFGIPLLWGLRVSGGLWVQRGMTRGRGGQSAVPDGGGDPPVELGQGVMRRVNLRTCLSLKFTLGFIQVKSVD